MSFRPPRNPEVLTPALGERLRASQYVTRNANSSDAFRHRPGPTKFVGNDLNPFTTQKIQVVDMDLDPSSEGMPALPRNADEMNEHSFLFALKVPRDDFAQKVTTLNLRQVNQFLKMMHDHALDVYEREEEQADVSKLSESNLRRIARGKLESLKFLSHKYVFELLSFVGVQTGNRFMNARTGPGITAVTTGSVLARNTSLNDTHELDQLWCVLRRETPVSPLTLVLLAFGNAAGPTLAHCQYWDLAGQITRAPARRVAMIANKNANDMQNDTSRRVALGMEGSHQSNHAQENAAPIFRVVVALCGIKDIRT